MSDVTHAIRVFLLDDHEVVRQGLRALLESRRRHRGGRRVRVRGPGGRARIPALRPDVAVLDARLPDGSGIEVCRAVRAVDPSIKALILTSYDDDEALFAAIMAGAAGYVLKEITGHRPGRRRPPGGRRQVAARPGGDRPGAGAGPQRPRTTAPELADLTEQELRLLALIAEGLTNRQIGEQMFLAEKTVKNYVSSVLAKLGLERRTQAAVLATQAARTRSPVLIPVRIQSLSSAGSAPGRAARATAARPVRLRRRQLEVAAEQPRPSPRVAQAALVPTWPASPTPSSMTVRRDGSWSTTTLDLGPGRPARGGPRWTAPRAARQQLVAQRVGHGGVDGPVGPHGRVRSRATRRTPGRASGARRAALAALAVLELEDRAADVADGGVEVVDRLVDPLGRPRACRSSADGLQLQAGGEEPLDHHVVQVAGDPLAVRQRPQQLRGRRPPGPGPGRARPGRRSWPAARCSSRRGARCRVEERSPACLPVGQVGAQRHHGGRDRRPGRRRRRRRPAVRPRAVGELVQRAARTASTSAVGSRGEDPGLAVDWPGLHHGRVARADGDPARAAGDCASARSGVDRRLQRRR